LYYDLCVIIGIFSRYVVGWLLAPSSQPNWPPTSFTMPFSLSTGRLHHPRHSFQSPGNGSLGNADV